MEGNIPPGLGNELEAADITWGQTAAKWYGNIIKELYDNATEKHIDFL